MQPECTHLNEIKVTKTTKHVCEDCVKIGDTWIHLRLCLTCGHVGCCDSSKNRHARKHYHRVEHPLIRSIEPGERWIWCYADDVAVGELPAQRDPFSWRRFLLQGGCVLVATTIRTTTLPNGEAVPVLGQGTWGMAERKHPREQEIQALRVGLDLGMTLIDTAEMYANGGAEKLVGEAIAGRREQVFLVSKVLPHNASRRGTVNACERSLRRLNTDHLDLYLLHWREQIPLEQTIGAFEALLREGKIRYWGVSNFDLSDMIELKSLAGGNAAATDQVLYNLQRRGIEYDLLPWCQQHQIPVMAYSPIEQGRMLDHPTLRKVAERHGATPSQVALAWVLRQDRVVAIPRAGVAEHVRQNRGALDIHLTSQDLAVLDRDFPPPSGPQALEML